MKEIQIIKDLASKIVKEYEFSVSSWEAFIEDTYCILELIEKLDNIKENLINYEDNKQGYLDGLIDEIDAIIYKKGR